MGQRFSVNDYKLLKHQPERVAGMDLETINTIVYSYMINDTEDYSVLHKTMQTYASMAPDRLILTAKRQSISLAPLLETSRDNRVNMIMSISRYCRMETEYYVRWPVEMKAVIMAHMNGARDVAEIFDFNAFTHNGVLSICNSIRFEGERISRPEDRLLGYLTEKIEDMFVYLSRTNPRLSNVVIFRMIEAFYKSSTRIIHGLGGAKIIIIQEDYPVVPRLPEEALPEIIEYITTTDTESETPSTADIEKYLRQKIRSSQQHASS